MTVDHQPTAARTAITSPTAVTLQWVIIPANKKRYAESEEDRPKSGRRQLDMRFFCSLARLAMMEFVCHCDLLTPDHVDNREDNHPHYINEMPIPGKKNDAARLGLDWKTEQRND